MIDLKENYEALIKRIRISESTYSRDPQSVRLLAVSKKQTIVAIKTLVELGQFAFGENYVQEALPKIQKLSNEAIEWHFIGKIQSNKCHALATYFQWVHTVSSFKEATLLSDKRGAEVSPLNICIQIKLDENPNRAGISLKDVNDLVEKVFSLSNLRLRGLMTLLPQNEDFSVQRKYYNLINQLYRDLQQKGYPLDTLSMGMSQDLEAAIAEGANLVRIGTALFGEKK